MDILRFVILSVFFFLVVTAALADSHEKKVVSLLWAIVILLSYITDTIVGG
jgi:hypothetical protein